MFRVDLQPDTDRAGDELASQANVRAIEVSAFFVHAHIELRHQN